MNLVILALISALGFTVSAICFAYAAPQVQSRIVAFLPIPCAIGAGAQLAHALYASGAIQ